MTLSEYLRVRGLNLEPLKIGEKRAVSDEQLAKIITLSEEALTMLIQQRIDSIADELIANATPEEVMVLRQGIVEIGGLIDDFRKLKKESETRKELRDAQKEEETPTPQPSPPVEEGKEGSL